MPSVRAVSTNDRRRCTRSSSASFCCAKRSREFVNSREGLPFTGEGISVTESSVFHEVVCMGGEKHRMSGTASGLGEIEADWAKTAAWYGTGLAHVWQPYTQMKIASPPLAVARTDGTRIVLADGRVLIDGVASWWTACHGYNHPHIGAAVRRQLELMPHIMFGGLVHEQALTLAARLAAMAPGGLVRVFFSESGSVAVEVALK